MDNTGLPSFTDSLDIALVLHDPATGVVEDVNAAAERLYGYSAAELRGMRVTELGAEPSSPSQERFELPMRPAPKRDEYVFEWQIERKDGELRWVESRLKRLEVDGSSYVLIEQRDITELRTRTNRLQLLYRIVRHNLRNEMTVVLGHADRIRQVTDEETVRECADRIGVVAEEVGELSDSVERIEQLATSDGTERPRTDVRAVLETLADEYADDHPEAVIEVAGDEGVPVRADEGLRVALGNAVENAIEHHDGPTPEVVLEAESDPEDGCATVRVRDDAPPIPEMEIDAVRGDARSELNHGTGVGLFVMKWCAESLGGTIDIEATHDDGNVVEFTFPLAQQATDGSGLTV